MAGIFDKARDLVGKNADKAKDLLGKHGDQVDDAVDKVADVVDDKTKHKHTDKIEGGAEKAKGAISKLAGDDE